MFFLKYFYNPVVPKPGIMVNFREDHPQMAARFRLVEYYILPRYVDYTPRIRFVGCTSVPRYCGWLRNSVGCQAAMILKHCDYNGILTGCLPSTDIKPYIPLNGIVTIHSFSRDFSKLTDNCGASPCWPCRFFWPIRESKAYPDGTLSQSAGILGCLCPKSYRMNRFWPIPTCLFDITRSERDAAGLWNMLKPPNREPTGNLCMKWCEGTSWQLFFLADRIKKEQFGRINLTRSPRSKGMTHVGGVHSHGGTPLSLDGCLQWKIRNKNWMIGGYPCFRKLPFLGNMGLITKIQEVWEITNFWVPLF